MTNNFREDLVFLLNKLKRKEKFSFSKYADGEYAVLVNRNLKNCDGWIFKANEHAKYRDELLKSFKFSDRGYYVGISCPCCAPKEDVNWMRNNVGSKPSNLTWANIFVNGNYEFFVNNFVPELKNHEIVLVANEKATPHLLPFKVKEFLPVSDTAWKDNFYLGDEIKKKKYEDMVFLFSAGWLGNILAYQLWEWNKNNTYIDVGSTLNPLLVGRNRSYLKNGATLNKMCIW